MTLKLKESLLVVILIFLSTQIKAAEESSPSLFELIEQSRIIKQGQAKQLVVENLTLTKQQQHFFWPLYEKYQGEMKVLNDRLLSIIKNYASHYKTDNLDDLQALNLLDQSFQIELDRIQIKRKYVSKFKVGLPNNLVARFFHLDNKIEALIKYGVSKEVPLVPVN